MKKREILLITIIIIGCIFGVIIDQINRYNQSLSRIDKGEDYSSVKDFTFFVNEPESCVWVRGLGQTYLDPRFLIKYETTVVLLHYKNEENIEFFKPAKLSNEWFQEECEDIRMEYGRLLDEISPTLLDKEWKHVYMEGYSTSYDADYQIRIYIYKNEVLVIAESKQMS